MENVTFFTPPSTGLMFTAFFADRSGSVGRALDWESNDG